MSFAFLFPSQRQHLVRAVDYSLPGRDSHPARGTKLRLAHTMPKKFVIAAPKEQAEQRNDAPASHEFMLPDWLCGSRVNLSRRFLLVALSIEGCGSGVEGGLWRCPSWCLAALRLPSAVQDLVVTTLILSAPYLFLRLIFRRSSTLLTDLRTSALGYRPSGNTTSSESGLA